MEGISRACPFAAVCSDRAVWYGTGRTRGPAGCRGDLRQIRPPVPGRPGDLTDVPLAPYVGAAARGIGPRPIEREPLEPDPAHTGEGSAAHFAAPECPCARSGSPEATRRSRSTTPAGRRASTSDAACRQYGDRGFWPGTSRRTAG